MDRDDGGQGGSPSNTMPKRFGDFEVLKPIGKGKFAVVYRAKRVNDDEIVALKRINVDSIDDKARDKCLKEVRLLQSLDHPNIIRYLDSFITDNDLVIVFEWAAAGDLKRQLRKAQERGVGFEERVIWKYFSQICDAIQHMHERRIMHRDLKPANIFLTLDGTVKVGDLGLSRELSEHTVQAHSKVGTPLYMSPEVLRGDGYDFKSDIWSLGCLLYELAMLKSPFKSEGLNLYLLFQKISQGDFQPLPENYSEQLRTLAYAMISTKREDRPEIAAVCLQARTMRAFYSDKSASSKRAAQAAQRDDESTGQSTNQSGSSTHAEPSAQHPADTATSTNVTTKSAHTSGDVKAEAKYDPAAEAEHPPAKSPSSPSPLPEEKLSAHTAHARREADAQADVKSDYSSQHGQHGQQSETDKRSKAAPTSSNGFARALSSYGYGDSATGADAAAKPKPKPAPAVSHRPKPSSAPSPYSPGSPAESRAGAADRPRDLYPADDDGLESDRASSALELCSPAFALMELVYSRLVVLGFDMAEGGNHSTAGQGAGAGVGSRDRDRARLHRRSSGRGRLLPMHFACDARLLGAVAGYDNNAQLGQFRRMVEVSVWLLRRLGGPGLQMIAHMDAEKDTPVSIAKQLLSAAQASSVDPGRLAEILPTALSVGHGEKVCTFLYALSERALETVAAEQLALRHADDDERGQGQQEGVEEEDGEGGNANGMRHGKGGKEDGEVEDDEDVEVGEEDEGPDEAGMMSPTEASGTFGGAAQHGIVPASIDPVRWKEETERISAHLARLRDKASIGGGGGGGWSEHLSTMQKVVRDCYQRGGGSDGSGGSAADDGAGVGRFSYVSDTLSALDAAIKQDLGNVRRSESLLNARQGMAAMGVDYRVYHKDLEELEAKAAGKTQRLRDRSDVLAALEEKVGIAAEQLEERAGGSEGGTGQTVALREAIKTLRDEIRQMTLTTGMLEAALLEKRTATAAHSRQRGDRQRRSRRSQGHQAKGEGSVEDLWADLI